MLDTAADAFGAALTAFDFTGDGRPDLAIGVPYEGIGNEVDAGAINVLIGSSSASGFGRSQAFDQGTPGISGAAERSDRFGGALGR